MRSAGRIRAFLNAPPARKRLALEAVAELLRARLVTLGPAASYAEQLGDVSVQDASEVSAVQVLTASEIGHMVRRVAVGLPIRAMCLQQAIAVRRMLSRRGIPAQVFLGIARNRAARATKGSAAHAWVTVGSEVVSGREGLEDFAVVARFA